MSSAWCDTRKCQGLPLAPLGSFLRPQSSRAGGAGAWQEAVGLSQLPWPQHTGERHPPPHQRPQQPWTRVSPRGAVKLKPGLSPGENPSPCLELPERLAGRAGAQPQRGGTATPGPDWSLQGSGVCQSCPSRAGRLRGASGKPSLPPRRGDTAAQEAAGASPCGQDPLAMSNGESSGASAGLYLSIDSSAQQPPLVPRTLPGAGGTEQHQAAAPVPPWAKADPLLFLLPRWGPAGPGRAGHPACSQHWHPLPHQHPPERDRPAPQPWLRAAGSPKPRSRARCQHPPGPRGGDGTSPRGWQPSRGARGTRSWHRAVRGE